MFLAHVQGVHWSHEDIIRGLPMSRFPNDSDTSFNATQLWQWDTCISDIFKGAVILHQDAEYRYHLARHNAPPNTNWPRLLALVRAAAERAYIQENLAFLPERGWLRDFEDGVDGEAARS